MAQPDQKITLYRGEDVKLNFSPTVTPSSSIATWGLTFSIAVPGSLPLLELTTTAGDITIVSGTDGTFKVTISRARTATLTASSPYVWDVWRTDTGSYERLAGGQLLALRPVLPTS